MTRTTRRLLLFAGLLGVLCLAFPTNCPAPLIWRKGEGWSWEREGVTNANNPKDQLALGKRLQEQKQYGNALSAYRRLIKRWPTSAAAQDARMGSAECLTALGYYYKSFKEYQQLIEKNPNSPYFDTALRRQFEIGNLFLAGERVKVMGIRLFSGLDKAVDVYEQVVKNGPFSDVGPASQFRIGLVYEKQKDYLSAVHAYEKFLERYPNNALAEEAQFETGWAYYKEAGRAEYDQNMANQAIGAFTDFLVRYPNGRKAARAEELRASLKQEQAHGLFRIGQFYEKRKDIKAALIYYNAVIEQNPRSQWASRAQQKVAMLTPRTSAGATATP
ncbi:MAG TPA: outer membrane protein assembly factor BamD [Verrucomicrobiae bacterium]|nr:outer membrane protein assembly factor BamD [Verrucomicrobiae bacterium]